MKWEDIDADDVWTLPTAPREKGNIGKVRLPPIVRAILDALPRFEGNPYVFAGRKGRHMSASGLFKTKFDAKLPGDMPHWTLHDLRRTARSLMSRAKVSSKDAERVLGHRLPGVEGIYDRYQYLDEKSEALAKLAALIDAIVHPRSADVFLNDAVLDAPNEHKTTVGGQLAISREWLKQCCVSKGWFDEADSENLRRAKVSNFINKLAGKRVVGTDKLYVWPVR
jgi:hypothetical protein